MKKNNYRDLVDGAGFDLLIEERNKRLTKPQDFVIHDKILDVMFSDITEEEKKELENLFGKTEYEIRSYLTNDDYLMGVTEIIRLVKKYVSDYELCQIMDCCFNQSTFFDITKNIRSITNWFNFCNIETEE
jgi:hypothetical protein